MNQTQSGNPGVVTLIGRSWWVLLLYGLLAVVVGAIAITLPLQAAAALAWAIGVLALSEGVVSALALFDRRMAVSKALLALYALVSISFGVLAIINPVATVGVLLLLIAVWLIVGGLYRIVFAIRVRREIEGEWLIVLSGVLGIALGILFVFDPLGGVVATTLWIGVGAVFYGVLQVLAAFRLRKSRRTV